MAGKGFFKKEILLIAFLAFAAFSNTLFNGFVGDEEIFIVDNSFYRSLQNIPSLFSAKYFPAPYHPGQEPCYSGSVAYRPALSATFFVDYWLWQLRPFGYHLTNVFIHVLNTILVYFLILGLLKNGKTALLTALLFCVHPVQSEAVSNIGYRADLLMTLYVLLSFICLFRHDKNGKDRIFFVLSVFFYFLAVFTKESAIVLIFFIVLYDVFFRNVSAPDVLKGAAGRYLPYLAVLAFYLFIYFCVFPNITLGQVRPMGGSSLAHAATALWIFVFYLKSLLLPFSVHMVPPVYAPVVNGFVFGKVLLSLVCLAGLAALAFKNVLPSQRFSFFVCWFLIALLPVSNIFPNANPMAFRYLYLPSIGFFAAVSIISESWLADNPRIVRAMTLAKVFLVVLCLAYLMPFNFLWKSNYSVANELIDRYPNHYKGHEILGFAFFNDGKYEEAAAPLIKTVELGNRNARIFRMLDEIEKRRGERRGSFTDSDVQ
jgi:protein O-mannosyl-transferase